MVDEAHKMSAHYYGNELKRTQRYRLGEHIRATARHFLLMTATPHNGKEEDFQAFLGLIDPDRFAGKYRPAHHRKWRELSSLLQESAEMFDAEGHRRKLIVFTEHRDTLDDLTARLRNLLGRPEAGSAAARRSPSPRWHPSTWPRCKREPTSASSRPNARCARA